MCWYQWVFMGRVKNLGVIETLKYYHDCIFPFKGWGHNMESDLTPSGTKGQESSQENRDKGWTGRGRWLTGSWDEWTTRLKTDIESRWRDLRSKCTNIGKWLFLAYGPLWWCSGQFNVDESLGNWKTSDQMTGHEKRGGRGNGRTDIMEEPTEVKR